jgi:hypothetical protein
MRGMVFVKATERQREGDCVGAVDGPLGLGDDRYMGAALALLGTPTKEIG